MIAGKPIKLRPPKGWATLTVDLSPVLGRHQWRLRLAVLLFRAGCAVLCLGLEVREKR